MTKKILIVLAVAILLALILWPGRSQSSIAIAPVVEAATTTPEIVPRFTHQQELWLASLEWCESKGDNTAVNPADLDGTPSYYAFQFKPSTFKWLGEKYGVIESGKTHDEVMELMKRYELQKAIVEYMMEDPTTKWSNQFPGCVRKLGWPPKPQGVL